MAVVAAIIIEPEGEQRKLLRVTLPLGMSLPQGTRVIIDQNRSRREAEPLRVLPPERLHLRL